MREHIIYLDYNLNIVTIIYLLNYTYEIDNK